MQRIDTVLLKVASRCNIACDYCYVYFLGDTSWSRLPKTMSVEVIDAIVNELGRLFFDQQHPFSIVLHGGEPLMLGHERLGRLLRGLRNNLGDRCTASIQTNGTLLSSPILDLCAETQTTVSVSLDGPRTVNDWHRLSPSGESTHERTLSGIRLLQAHSHAAFIFTGVLCVIDPRSDPAEVYSYFKSLRVPSVNFLLRDGNHSKAPEGKVSFESTEYGSWMARLWDVYYNDDDPVPVKTLDDVARLVLGGRATKEGFGTTDYAVIVIDTDGRISKNDTLKSAFDGADAFEAKWSVFEDRLSAIAQTDAFRQYVEFQQPTSIVCRQCPYLLQCGGGMPLSRWSDERQFENPSVYCNDHKLLINHVRNTLASDLLCSHR